MAHELSPLLLEVIEKLEEQPLKYTPCVKFRLEITCLAVFR